MIIERSQYMIGNARVELIGKARFPDCSFDLPIFIRAPGNERTREMHFRQLRIEQLGYPKLFFGARYATKPLFLVIRYPGVSKSKLGMSQGIVRIELDRFLEQIYRCICFFLRVARKPAFAEV